MFTTYEAINTYYENLKIIGNVKFTSREIDVIACILNGRTKHKEIAILFSIAPGVVEAHKSNINRKLQHITGLNVREFVEKSDKYYAIRDHYTHLLHWHAFEETLKRISQINKSKSQATSIYFLKDKSSNFLIGSKKRAGIQTHLHLAGFTVKPKDIKHTDNSDIGLDINDGNPIIFVVSESFINSFNTSNEIKDFLNKIHDFAIESKDSKNTVLFLSIRAQVPNNILAVLPDAQCITVEDNYYFVFFEFLLKLNTHTEAVYPLIEDLISKFKENYHKKNPNFTDKIDTTNDTIRTPLLLKLKSVLPTATRKLLLLLTMITIITSIFIHYEYNKEHTRNQPITSDLIMPIKTVLLERPSIIQQIKEKLQGTDGIKTIVLTGIVGMGGAGKTTMARYYGKTLSASDVSVVWELNAENRDTLINSFRELSHRMADTSELKKELESIQQIQIPEIQEKQFLNFVKSQLKIRSSWVLIYDNMESFAQMNAYFPHDTDQWGNGKVIITTRNEHIKETNYIKPENVIHIDELNEAEMLTLFSKILYDKEPSTLSKIESQNAKLFLKKIPPFPLDVSVAAYSIKNTHVTFAQYIKNVNDYSSNYESMQTQIIKEVSDLSDYNKTRYGIISSTIAKINKTNPDFKELFLLICCLDSQNIPYGLLKKYQNTTEVENLVYNLRQNGLLIRESYSDFAKEKKIISIHRSTQEIGLTFLMNLLSPQEKELFIQHTIQAINDFYQECTKNNDIKNIIALVPHMNALSSVINKIDIDKSIQKKYETDLYLIIGYAHYKWTKNLAETRIFFKKVLERTKNNPHLSPKVLAVLLKDLCTVCAIMNYIDEALTYCKQSIDLCKTFSDAEFIMSDSLQVMGASYRKMDNFEKALEFINLALEAIPNTDSNQSKELKAEIYTQLGHLYLTKYLNKKEALPAETYDVEALKLLSGFDTFHTHAQPLPAHISCQIARYRWKYSEVFLFHYGNYDEAYNHLQESEYIMNTRCIENIHLKGRIFGLMGEVLLGKNDLVEAERKLTESINILTVALGPNACWIDNIRRAEAKIRLGKFDEGYEDCMHIFKLNPEERSNFHDLRHWTTFYHAAFAKYKLGDYKKSLVHFEDFIKNMNSFCKNFLSNNEYTILTQTGALQVIPYDENREKEDIQRYLENSLKIFTTIYGTNHPFVQDYISINASQNDYM